MTFQHSIPLLALATLFFGCGTTMITNTDVPDTGDNRAAVEFVERYRHAVEERNAAGVLALVSDHYFDDNGTLESEDDMDRDSLATALNRWTEDLRDVRYEIRYRRVSYTTDRTLIDFTYTGSFKLRTIDGDRWSRRLADNRVELIREDNDYRIISGL